MKAIADILSNAPGARDRAHADGIHIGGERYVVTVIDDGTIYARQVRYNEPFPLPLTTQPRYSVNISITRRGSSSVLTKPPHCLSTRQQQGRSGICIAKSQVHQAILVGHHNEQAIAGNAVAATGALADWLDKPPEDS